ncbi:MAG: cbb3-type cytochrome c oxidase subunit I [Planctomycetota bacterium]|nr:cbb3-type cytochrome c oxidase subunit I [Planctomycetota bacterium]
MSGHHDVSYLAPKETPWKTIWSWVYTVDHKKIGMMYLVTTLLMFFLGGVAALAMRLELFEPTTTVVNQAGQQAVEGQFFKGWEFTEREQLVTANNVYNRAFTLHGAIMVFLFIIPAIPAALGNIFLPIMLGAKDVAFPKLNLMSWYTYVFGSLFALWSILQGGVETGWTFYTPYSSSTNWGGVTAMVLGAFILGFSSIFTGINFIATVHKLRVPGMGWFDMPLFVWAVYATAILQVLATPVLGITLLMLVFERTFRIGIFDPALGGDPVLFQHFFWFYSHPAVYIMILPGMGIISEIIAVQCRKRIFGYRAIAFSSIAIAGISFLVWAHHMFTAQTAASNAIFSALTFLVAIPTAIKVFNWIATMYKASIAINTPMLYAMSFLFNFTIGGLTGPPLATLATDIHLHDTYFVVAHFHYVMMGGTVLAFIGGLHHWWPKFTGRMYNENVGRLGAVLVFIGFNVTFFIQFFLGTQGMPRRYATYINEFTWMHQISTIGSFILATGLVIHLLNFVQSWIGGPAAPRNPWGGLSFEWETDSPPIEHNFPREPVITHGPYDFDTTLPPHCDPREFPLPDPAQSARYSH